LFVRLLFLPGEKLLKKRRKVLTHGDEIELGATSKHSGAAPSTGGVKLVFHKAEKWAETEGRVSLQFLPCRFEEEMDDTDAETTVS